MTSICNQLRLLNARRLKRSQHLIEAAGKACKLIVALHRDWAQLISLRHSLRGNAQPRDRTQTRCCHRNT